MALSVAETNRGLAGPVPHISISNDSVADAALRTAADAPNAEEQRCDACDGLVVGEPEGRGLLVWFRGEDFRMEEPVLCGPCAMAIGIAALAQWSADEEEEG